MKTENITPHQSRESELCNVVPGLELTLPAGSPHVAYVALWYPVFTQPFIFREVEGLGKLLPLQVYTLYGSNLRHCSDKMRSDAARTVSFGVRGFWAATWALFAETIKNPGMVWRIFNRACLRSWNTLESLGENLWAFGIGMALGRRFREDGIDFVYAPWPRGAATAAWIGAKLAGIPFAIAARGDNLAPADPDLGDKFAHAAFVRANNAADQKRIEDFDKSQANGKTLLVYNSLTLPPNRIKSQRFTGPPLKLLALGRFDVTKGFDVLLEACSILKKRGIDFTLTLAGGGGRLMGLGKLEERLRSLRRTLDLEKEVSMPGIINHDQLPQLLASHDIFTAPCVIDFSGKRDGIPNTVIEALASGMPVVASDINALPEVVRNGQTGLLVPQKDPAALADAIIWLKDYPEEAIIMGENGAKLVAEMFDPQKNGLLLARAIRDNACVE